MLMMDLDLETKLGDMRGGQAHIPTIKMEASGKDLY